ncbi:MAG: hypothetical protein AAFX94_03700 [Myxococcota bacterium]
MIAALFVLSLTAAPADDSARVLLNEFMAQTNEAIRLVDSISDERFTRRPAPSLESPRDVVGMMIDTMRKFEKVATGSRSDLGSSRKPADYRRAFRSTRDRIREILERDIASPPSRYRSTVIVARIVMTTSLAVAHLKSCIEYGELLPDWARR